MLKRIVLYGFPLYIVFAEVLVNHFLLNPPKEATNIGSSMAVAGISLLFPVLVPRQRRITLADGEVVTVILDYTLVQTAWIFLFLLAGIWIYCLYVSNLQSPPVWWTVPAPLAIGAATYIIGVVFTELKERSA